MLTGLYYGDLQDLALHETRLIGLAGQEAGQLVERNSAFFFRVSDGEEDSVVGGLEQPWRHRRLGHAQEDARDFAGGCPPGLAAQVQHPVSVFKSHLHRHSVLYFQSIPNAMLPDHRHAARHGRAWAENHRIRAQD